MRRSGVAYLEWNESDLGVLEWDYGEIEIGTHGRTVSRSLR